MKTSSKPSCPDPDTLLQFIQGRLEPPTLDQCEVHVSDCQTCHETLRGLDANDTLSHYVSDALDIPEPTEDSDSQAIDGLMQRLMAGNLKAHSKPLQNHEDALRLADRAAEVLRCVEPPAEEDDDSLGTLGDYRLLRLIGAGGTGVVFQAKDQSLDRLVALKVLRPSLGDVARDRFIAEARLAASIEHENVVTIYQIGQQDRLAFIAMQWVPGETLEARLAGQSELHEEDLIREFVSQIASGLSAAHERQLIHRDIKPANIWICEDTGRIKILDFGLARIADEDSSLTQTGMLAGTPSFMSPEQTRGMELDPRSDLFSLGCVMYLLLSGRLPFSAPTVLGTLQTIQTDSPQPPVALNPDCDQELSDLTMNLLEKQPGNRMASAQNLIHCLGNDRSDWPQPVPKVTGTFQAPSAAKPISTQPKRLRNWIIAVSLIGIAAVGAWLMSPQIFRIVTDQGELVINASDDNIKVQVLENGDLVRVLDASTKDSFDIKSGEYSFNVVSENESQFEITPKSVSMTRGGKQIVTVTMSTSNVIPNKNDQNAFGADASVDAANDHDALQAISIRLLASKARKKSLMKQYSRQHPSVLAVDREIAWLESLSQTSFHPDRFSDVDSIIASLKVEKDMLATRLGEGHPSVIAIQQKIESTEKHYETKEPDRDRGVPIYGGRSFDDWFLIARNDLEPQTVSEALIACATLAEGDQRQQVEELLSDLMRQNGVYPVPFDKPTAASIYCNAFIKTLELFQPTEVWKFVATEIKDGNESSLGSCVSVIAQLHSTNEKKRGELRENRFVDLTPLMQRVQQGELKADKGVTNFMSMFLTQRNDTRVDESVCQQFLDSVDAEARLSILDGLLTYFRNGQMNNTIESDFFSPATTGPTRQRILKAMQNWRSSSAGVTARENAARLSNRLLTRSIDRLLQGESGLEFSTYDEIWFDEIGVVHHVKQSDGSESWIQSYTGGLSNEKPEGTRHVDGPPATIRILLTQLCENVEGQIKRNLTDKQVFEFTKKWIGPRGIERTQYTEGLKDLKIAQDLATLSKVSSGDIGSYFDLSRFVVGPNSRLLARESFGKKAETTEPANVVAIEPSAPSKEAPVYRGRTFEQWFKIAENDREPKTVADAIAACAVLAEADQKKIFFSLFRSLIRQHGASQLTPDAIHGNEGSDEVYFNGFSKAILQFKNAEIVEFIQTEIDTGNEQSIGFCSSLINYGLSGGFSVSANRLTEFQTLLRLNCNRLLQRICDKKIALDTNVRFFLTTVLNRKKTVANLSLAKKSIIHLKVSDRPWVYQSFIDHFGDNSFDGMIEADFLAESTSGATRESLLSMLLRNFDSGETYAPAGEPIYTANSFKVRLPLAIRLITKSISLKFEDDSTDLKFDSWQTLSFNEHGIASNGTGGLGGGGFGGGATTVNVQQIKGLPAVVRHLLSQLCEIVSENELADNDRETVRDAVKAITDDDFKPLKSSEKEEFEKLKIEDDLKALLNFINGKTKEAEFSTFVSVLPNRQNGGIF
ncbi:serine/threonine protein kinase [Mariniblastus fucicola]|uniref:Serine/threonine-protein kinase PrkC n=1 Tax=Mariniblastus fucicola TaxID=980251 RepID=A0A5B9P638_9BACT|nr:serine/threonine-protein kinase [Mariniblastus fucicola]QEG20462.1 Serine/threonine-protein kinase PrkC [Mariniblastus fucicola]